MQFITVINAGGMSTYRHLRVLTSGAGRLLTNPAHSSFALCNLGADDIRRDTDRLAAWVVALRAANNDMTITLCWLFIVSLLNITSVAM